MRTKLRTLSFAILAALLTPLAANAEIWAVKLTPQHKQALAETKSNPNHSALAIAPGGQWGSAWNYSSAEEANQRALNNCKSYLKRGNLDCVIVAQNGKMIVGKTVDLVSITKVYKPLNGKKAARFFGGVNIQFQGDRVKALEQYEFTKRDGQAWRTIPKDMALRRALTNHGLASNGQNGWAIYLGEKEATQYASPKSGKVMVSTFKEWAISKDGLLCMFFGKHANGNPRSTTCMIIETALETVRCDILGQSVIWNACVRGM